MIKGSTLQRFFAQKKTVSFKVKPQSELQQYLRKSRTQGEVAWQRKVKNEWFFIAVAAAVGLNLIYNVFPQYWFAQNLFMNSEESLSMEAKREV